MNWVTRIKIVVGVAKALNYLHHEANPPIIHRHVKSGNILIDSTYNPRLADFGLSVVDARGTMGYIDPEYFINENLSFQSDTYGLGVVLLELLTGCLSLDGTRPDKEISLVQWVRLVISCDLLYFPF
ncbi:Serine/threonine-protein kinase PBL36 [Linum perenne]